jgi:hypothetical protein
MSHGEIARRQEPRAKIKGQGARVFYILIFALCYMLFASVVDARVKGKCKDCHSMHYSYEGNGMTYGNRQ